MYGAGSVVLTSSAADIATAAVGRIGLAEIGQQHAAAATVVRSGIVGHGADALLKTGPALFIDGGRQDELFAVDTPAGEGDESCAPVGNVVEDAPPGKGEQTLIDLVARKTGGTGQTGFVDVDVVGKKTTVGAEYLVDHLLELRIGIGKTVEFVAAHQEHEARGVLLFFGVVDVTRTGQQAQGAFDRNGEMPEIAAEFGQIEGAHDVQSVAHGHLIVITEVFVDGGDERAVGEGVGNPARQPGAVGRAVKQYGIGGLTVAAGTARFLKIGFGRIGQIEMEHQTDVGFVDAHTKCIGGHHDAYGAGSPGLLAPVFFVLGETGMVVGGAVAPGGEPGGQFAAAFTAAGINDDGTGETVEHVAQLAFLVVGGADDVGQIGPVEGHAEHVRGTESQLLLDVVDHFGGGCGGQGQDGTVGQQAADVGNAGVGGTEIVAPLGDAVGFVDRDKTDGNVRQFGQKKGSGKPFGRNIKKLVVAVDTVFEQDDGFFTGKAAIERGSLDATTAQLSHLILHQGNQGRDDQTNPGTGQCRNLKRNRLTTAGWHQAERVAAVADTGDDILLDATKMIVAPVGAEYLEITVVHDQASSDGRISSI